MTSAEPEARAVWYKWKVHDDVPTPIPSGTYVIRLVEGGRYRNAASGRAYSIREILADDPPRIRYEYTRGHDAEHVERVGDANNLAVVQALDGTPSAIVAVHDRGEQR